MPIAVPDAQRQLKFVSKVTVALIGLLIAWTFCLSVFGDHETGDAVAFLLYLVFMGALFWTVHLRKASLAILFLVFPGLIVLFMTRCEHYGPLIALTFAVNVCAMLPRAIQIGDDYRRLVESRAELIQTQKSILAKTAEAERLSAENWRIANTDMLTGLGNRRRFFAQLATVHAETRAGGKGLAVGILGLDGFKTINDSHDHSVGDQVLCAVGERLVASLGPAVKLFRLGSDEFALILREQTSEAELMALGERLIEMVRLPAIIGDLRLTIGCSIGFARDADAVRRPADLYEQADYALHRAKRSGRLCAAVFNEALSRAVREAARIERALREADLQAELHLRFQPIVDTRRGRTQALECLARWTSPTLGSVPPDKFIVVAEKSGLIGCVTPVLLRKALEAAKAWPEEIGLSFNLSGHDVGSIDRIANVIAIVAQSGIAPHRLEFEVTETALMMNVDESADNLRLLKRTGARIALDDFGTGYSSLSYMQRLPLDKIKVDGAFVKNLGACASSRKIVRSIAALSRDLDLECVIEGVETLEQLERVKEIGCHLVQGYHFAKPMDAAEVCDFLRDERQLCEASSAA